ncbi:hypothetical protein GCM10029992_17030 [Glycomyces albus]
MQPLAEEVETLTRQRDSAESNLTDLRRQLGLASGDEDSSEASFESDPPRVPINKQREPADIDQTQQLPIVR